MEGNTFLFRVLCPMARKRILSQGLWQIDGQTMFVAKWCPGIKPIKPELSAVPVWLEFRQVPHQFFSEEGLQHIAGLVGHPIVLHPSTDNMTNNEVAKVYTIIDPLILLPEAVNVKFESGEVRRVTVSSPLHPSICGHGKQVGHTASKWLSAPVTCKRYKSVKHSTANCPRSK